MLPFTNAESWPNIGFSVTAGSSGTMRAKAAFASSLGFGIFIGPRGAGIGRHFPPTPTTVAKGVYQPESKGRFGTLAGIRQCKRSANPCTEKRIAIIDRLHPP